MNPPMIIEIMHAIISYFVAGTMSPYPTVVIVMTAQSNQTQHRIFRTQCANKWSRQLGELISLLTKARQIFLVVATTWTTLDGIELAPNPSHGIVATYVQARIVLTIVERSFIDLASEEEYAG